MKPANLLFIMSDEHSRRVLGCYGHPMVRTPHLDQLAAGGVRFTDAYCNSPICVPSRASFAAGRYVHQIRFWDNGIPYDGSVPSWGHRLIAAGHRSISIGKLHYRSTADANGFDREVMPLHVVDGVGDLSGMIRDDLPVRSAALRMAEEAGRGDSSYQGYDDRIVAAAQEWLRGPEPVAAEKPWVLFVSLVCPHFPLIARPEFYDLYPEDRVPWPALYAADERPDHPFIAAMRECMVYDKAFDERRVRRAIAAYLGMVTFLDQNVGKLLATLAETGLGAQTRVIYTSDHGDNLGTRGLWGKSTMYEESAGVPMMMAGPGIPAGVVCREPVSLVDCFPTILDFAGVAPHSADRDLPGRSLRDVVRGAARPPTMFCEYHAVGAATAAFMIRKGAFKYVHYVGMPPQLFDLDADPQETRDLGTDPGYRGLVAECEAELRRIVDPDAADAQARADQRARIAAFGGRDALLKRGSFGYSPVPGTTPVYS
ncbi:MAG TPA: sulfatase-like hydrolase/transferase [Acetobacteraceae bacterium]|nr:sulfatase-like hydrolase/transferase [Acetobacteraceae bacterium]